MHLLCTCFSGSKTRSHKKMKIKTTETFAPNKPSFHQEPTHDEIALAAFLAWERDGRQTGRKMKYWCEAKSDLRSARLKKAEAAAQSVPQWPRPSRTAPVKPAAATGPRKLTTSVQRNTAPKNSVVKKTARRS